MKEELLELCSRAIPDCFRQMPKSLRIRDDLSRAGSRGSRLPVVFLENELLQILQQFKLPAIHAFRTGKDHGIGFDWFVFEFEGEGVDLFVVSFLYFATNINIYFGVAMQTRDLIGCVSTNVKVGALEKMYV